MLVTRRIHICFFFFLCRACGNVLTEDARKCYGKNEVLKCITDCPPEKTCKTKDVQFKCLQSGEGCKQKCVCEDGYYRNPLGDCISKENCDRCPGEHEYFACSSFCDNVCSELDKQNKTHCPIINIVCNKKCYCEDNFARDDKKNCIPIEDCKKTKSNRNAVTNKEKHCGLNEEYTQCISSWPPELCMALEKRTNRPKDLHCVPGCQCQDGYLRIEEGSPCIPIHECPQLVYMPGYK